MSVRELLCAPYDDSIDPGRVLAVGQIPLPCCNAVRIARNTFTSAGRPRRLVTRGKVSEIGRGSDQRDEHVNTGTGEATHDRDRRS